MATPAQINANRLNAQKSTGPQTVDGKANSSRNAVRHNLSPGATFTLLPGEDLAAFEQLVRDYRDEFKPRTAHELFLVNQMIQAQWRIGRIERLQAELLDKILNVPAASGKTDEGAIIAATGFAHGDALDKLERYGRAAERAYFRANKELRQYRAEKQNEPKSALPASASPRPAYDYSRSNLPEPAGALGTGHSPLATQPELLPAGPVATLKEVHTRRH
jgi:hypothetical protein